ncbi:hypothetical protein L7F22_049869 [Adiantum nelumboides]|nr:hypothetical protein [Adiantum nelumboides]
MMRMNNLLAEILASKKRELRCPNVFSSVEIPLVHDAIDTACDDYCVMQDMDAMDNALTMHIMFAHVEPSCEEGLPEKDPCLSAHAHVESRRGRPPKRKVVGRGRPKVHADVGFECHATNKASEQDAASRKAGTSHSCGKGYKLLKKRGKVQKHYVKKGRPFDMQDVDDSSNGHASVGEEDECEDELLEAEDASASQEAAFGDLIRKKGYTDDDIANLIAGFYEPTKMPHPDDYKYIDVDAEIRRKRREIELQRLAEMAKRWVRKVDEQGFAHAVGRRKTSSARVWIKEGQGRIVINKKHHDMYFVSMDDRAKYLEPFILTDTLGMFDTFVLVRGGGTTGQAGAVRLGVSRALMWYEPSWRKVLKKAGLLMRDPRMVERKKPGKAKARKSFQWVKR